MGDLQQASNSSACTKLKSCVQLAAQNNSFFRRNPSPADL